MALSFFLFSRSFEVLANAIGFKKSFSTSDILGIESSAQYSGNKPFFNLNRSHSEIQLSNYAPLFRLEASSRSLSTWVAVGDTSATTQLPSPQVSPLMTPPPKEVCIRGVACSLLKLRSLEKNIIASLFHSGLHSGTIFVEKTMSYVILGNHRLCHFLTKKRCQTKSALVLDPE